MTFNPNEHLIKISGKDYLPVQWRLCWFRELCPGGTLDTEEIEVDPNREVIVEVEVWNAEKHRKEKVTKTAKGYARYKAIVTDGKGGRATGHGSETAADFPDYAEKAETKAIGRALAALGYGTQFTGEEFIEAHRIVDSPVDRSRSVASLAVPEEKISVPDREPMSRAGEVDSPADEKQIERIGKLSKALKKDPPDYATLTAAAAASLIAMLVNEYHAKRARARAAALPVS